MQMKHDEIIGWDFKEGLDRIPLYTKIEKTSQGLCWHLYKTDIDMIPKGLKGVDIVVLAKPKNPTFVAPDFQGIVAYLDESINIKTLNQKEVIAAKKRYIKYKHFVEAPRYVQRKSPWGSDYYSVCALPSNIFFYQKNGKVYLDISKVKTNITPQVEGVDEVIMPQKIAHHRGCQMVHSKPRIKE